MFAGEVFHDPVPQQLSFAEAQSYCRAAGAELATTAQLYLAWGEGLDRCSPGWLSDGSVRYPIVTPRERCGGPQAGVKTLYRFSNRTGFPEPTSLHDVYCFKSKLCSKIVINKWLMDVECKFVIEYSSFCTVSSDPPTASSVHFIEPVSEDIGKEVMILNQTDQELINHYVEQVEREVKSVLESFAFVSPPSTMENLSDTQLTDILNTTQSPLNTTFPMDLPQTFNDTSSPADVIFTSLYSTAQTNSTIGSNDTYDIPQNTSALPLADNATDSQQNVTVTVHPFEIRSTTGFPEVTYEPYSQNQTVLATQPEEQTKPTERYSPEERETVLHLNESRGSYSESNSNDTSEENILEATLIPLDNMFEAKVEETTVSEIGPMSLSTQSTSQEEELRTQTSKDASKDLTSPYWVSVDGSGGVSQG